MKCDFTSKEFAKEAAKVLSPLRNSNLDPKQVKQKILDAIVPLAQSMGIDSNYHLKDALDILQTKILKKNTEKYKLGFNEEVIPSTNQIKGALLAWKKQEKSNKENTTSEKLNKYVESFKEDPYSIFGKAFYAKQRAVQQANSVCVHSILFNKEDGVLNSEDDINFAIESQQENLLKILLDYLESRGITGLPQNLYDKYGHYTGILETMSVQFWVDSISEDQLAKAYLDKDYKFLDAFNAYVILNNFDTILQDTFGKAISIDPDKDKFTLYKYKILGGSNVYTTWRTNEEIDLSKEINNISQAIVNSIPYINTNGTSSERNIKFNEFCYIVTKIKDLGLNAKQDYIMNFEGGYLNDPISQETQNLLQGKSFLSVLSTIRENPQKYLPAIFEVLNNQTFINKLKEVGFISAETFSSLDEGLMYSIYKGLFDYSNDSSLFKIQHKGNGFDGVNYYSFIAQTIDSIYKAGFMQYIINTDGTISCRNMYDQSISNIEWNIKDSINSIHSNLIITDDKFEEIRQKYNIQANNLETPTELSLILDYNGVPLEVKYNLVKEEISYFINNTEITAFQFEPVAQFIQDMLKQNLNFDLEYLEQFKFLEGEGADYTKDLLNLSTRVLFNQFIQFKYLNNLSPTDAKAKLKNLFPSEKKALPRFNTKLNQINLVTDADSNTITTLAQAKAVVTGRLTSSQVLDSEGNALASSTLSRLISTLPYQIDQQTLNFNSAASEFSLWKTGIFKGIFQLKEIKDNTKGKSKQQTKFSVGEMVQATAFTDFVLGLLSPDTNKSPLGNGLVTFYPSENSDKTYVGRMLIDLKNLKIGEQTLYSLVLQNKVNDFIPQICEELGKFYQKVFDNINTEWSRVSNLLTDFVINYNNNLQATQTQFNIEEFIPEGDIAYGQWEYLNLVANKVGMTSQQLLNQLTTEYNNSNPQNPIVLIDQVHYSIDKNGNFVTNASLLENLNRFKDPYVFQSFIQTQEVDILKSLLKENLHIEANDKIKELLGPELSKEWIDSYTNEIILAKEYFYDFDFNTEEDNIQEFSIRRSQDINTWDLNSMHGFILNPILHNYNLLNYFFTQEFMNSSVGAYYGHPAKGSFDEKSRKNAQDKRNVSMTAAMHPFVQNLINGTPKEINVAVVPDPEDTMQTISGDVYSINPTDGATYESPFFSRLENNSLCGARVGNIKKTFFHFYNEKTGTGGIIKTASFPLTNYYIRRSKFYQTMMQNMTDHIWRDKNGEILADFNILKDYNGNNINIKSSGENGKCFYKDTNGNHFAINDIQYNSNNDYIISVFQTDMNGNDSNEILYKDSNGNLYREENESYINIKTGEILSQKPVVHIDTNYKLWKALGGEKFEILRNGELIYSEDNLDIVTNIINKAAIKRPNVSVVRFQEDIYQPLKQADIQIMPTMGAIKQGAANINPQSVYTETGKTNFFKIKLNQAGIQLDKEHNADGEDLSIMTQVLSACAARGYSQEQTQQLYNALASLARTAIKEYQDAFDEYFKAKEDSEEAKLKYQKVIQDTLINALASSSNSQATLQIVTQELLDKARKGEDFELQDIPYSDPSVFRKLHSTIAVAMSKAAIKIKVDGLLAVLCPSFNIVKIYNGKTYDSFENVQEIIKEQEEQDSNEEYNLVNNTSKIKLGRTYRVVDGFGNEQLVPINIQNQYYSLVDKLNTDYIDQVGILESYQEGDVVFNAIPIEYVNYGELGINGGRPVAARAEINDSGIRIIKLDRQAITEKWNQKAWRNPLRSDFIGIIDFQSEEDLLNWVLVHEYAHHYFEDNIKGNNENRANSLATQWLCQQNPNYKLTELREQFAPKGSFEGGRNLGSYECEFSGKVQFDDIEETVSQSLIQQFEGKSFNINDVESVYNLATLKDRLNKLKKKQSSDVINTEISIVKNEIKKASEQLQLDLEQISKNGVVKLRNGVSIKITQKEITPYEVILPKLFAEKFGLREYDDINAIKNNPNFFIERLLQKLSNQKGIEEQNYTIGMMRMNGNHVYLLDKNDAVYSDTFRRKSIQYKRENGVLYRVKNGKLLYRMNQGDEVWEHTLSDGSVAEVVVTSKENFPSYLDSIKHNTLNISPKYLDKDLTILRIIEKSNSDKRYLQTLKELGGRSEDIIKLQNINSMQDLEKSQFEDYFTTLGKNIHTSFLESLKVVMARVPAQSMQSFMPMVVVSFEAPDINTAYVSNAQILFQGSDYDIDAGSIASFAFNDDGEYILHSPYGNIETPELLKASKKLPFPTGKTLGINKHQANFGWDKYISVLRPDNPLDLNTPIHYVAGNMRVNTKTPEAIRRLGELITKCNNLHFIPEIQGMPTEKHQQIVQIINKHNTYNKDSEEYSKNYIVSAMYDIGLNPINLVESQQAMDEIKSPLKKIAENTKKAQKDDSLGNPGSFLTNIKGLIQNMGGKQGVGICAVGLKSFFALTARYNEVLRNGTYHEKQRLASELEIAGNNFKMLANAYSPEQVQTGILKGIFEAIDQGLDAALVLSALLSLATDNAKDLALDKLNAENMLGMYIFGITVGINFQTLADIIASESAILINEYINDNIFTGKSGKSLHDIFDMIELGPTLYINGNISDEVRKKNEALSQQALLNLYNSDTTLADKIQYLENLKHTTAVKEFVEGTIEFNKNIEKAQQWLQLKYTIDNEGVYEDFKKLAKGGDELRLIGQELHINQGLESSYQDSISRIDTLVSVINSRQYDQYRTDRRNETNPKDYKLPEVGDFNLHHFVAYKTYRDACVDVYGKTLNKEMLDDFWYVKALMDISKKNTPSAAFTYLESLPNSKFFYNALDVLQVPHYLAYLNTLDQLDQSMKTISIKYRAIWNLGRRAIKLLRAFSAKDKQTVFRRTENLVDSLIRDRFLIHEPKIILPEGSTFFFKENLSIKNGQTKQATPITLGTIEGNATFKHFMENVIIPNLQKETNNPLSPLNGNKFIQYLAPTIYSNNIEFSTTVCYAPSINMSPRSDTDKYLFETVKQDFNKLKTTSFRYKIGENYYDLINLFWIYNQIAFNGRIGENTLTSIFQDSLDYKIVKRFRKFESELDLTEDFSEQIPNDKLLKATALKKSPWNTKMSHFYYEDPASGKISYWGEYKESSNIADSDIGGHPIVINGYTPNALWFSQDDKFKNYITQSSEYEEIVPIDGKYSKGSFNVFMEKGVLKGIKINDDTTGESHMMEIPFKLKQALSNKKLITKTILTTSGSRTEYNTETITLLVKNSIENDNVCN